VIEPVIMADDNARGRFFRPSGGNSRVDLDGLHLKNYTMNYGGVFLPLNQFDTISPSPYTIKNCVFENINLNNTCFLQHSSEKITLEMCIFKDFNYCLIDIMDSGDIYLLKSEFYNFHRHEQGGVMYIENMTVKIEDCKFDSCSSDHDGGDYSFYVLFYFFVIRSIIYKKWRIY
jgi:hypothetical protein